MLSPYSSATFALMNSSRVGSYGSFVSIWVWSGVFSESYLSLFCAPVVTSIIKIWSTMRESSVSSVGSGSIVSVAWCLTLTLWTMLRSYCMRRSRHHAGFPVASATLRFHLRAWWSVRTVNLVPTRYDVEARLPKRLRDTLGAWCLGFFFRSLKSFDQYPIGSSTCYSCFWNSKHPIYR